MSELGLFGRLPTKFKVAWVTWAIGAIILFAIAARFRSKETVDSVSARVAALQAQSQQQYESLLHEIRQRTTYTIIQVGTLQLPPPQPDKHFGWPAAILDTTQAKSLTAPEVESASRIFAEISDPNSLSSLVLSGKVRIDYLRLLNPTPNVPKQGGAARYAVQLQLRNLTQDELRVAIPRGQVFENAVPNTGYQNLVAAETTNVTLAPDAVEPARVTAYCLNHRLAAPANGVGSITPLKVAFEFVDQDDLWAKIDALRKRQP